MEMVECVSLEDLKSFVPNSWGIPEPSSAIGRKNGIVPWFWIDVVVGLEEGLDLIIVPGMGFDRKMNRIGHGKGYYDRFFKSCSIHAKESGRQPPFLGILLVA